MRLADALERVPDFAARVFGRHRSDTLPLRLSQGRIYVFPSGAGFAFAGALLVMLVGAINYGLSLGYGLVFLLFGVGIAGTLQSFRNLLGLSVTRVRAEPVFAGEEASLCVTLENPSPFRRPGLRVRLASGERRVELAERASADIELPMPTRRRGWLPVERVTLATSWPLGLVRAWSVLRPQAACLVYPAPEGTPPPLPDGAAEIDGERPRIGGDDDFAGLRGHRLTDSPRHIAWKAFAAGGPLLTKEFSRREGGSLVLDWHSLPPTLDDDARAARLCAWVLAAEARGLRYALHTPDGECPAGRGAQHLQACLARLALARSPDERG